MKYNKKDNNYLKMNADAVSKKVWVDDTGKVPRDWNNKIAFRITIINFKTKKATNCL